MRFENSLSWFKSGFSWESPGRQDLKPSSRYTHILVPISLDPEDRGPLLLGMELAAVHRATLTVLHVMPRQEQDLPADGLDAIRLLHRALHQFGRGSSSRNDAGSAERTQRQLAEFLAPFIPEQLRGSVNVRVTCHEGTVADGIAQFAKQSNADLVIISAGASRRWLPILPAHVRRLLHLVGQQVILVPPGMTARGARQHELSPAAV